MLLLDAFKHKNQVSQTKHKDDAAGNRLNVAELICFRQMEKVMQQTVEDLELFKIRLNQLEQEHITHVKKDAVGRGNTEYAGPVPLTPLLPVAELKQLAEMAKRLR